MSFFGHLLAGAVGGAADGYSSGLAQQEKMDLQRQMQAERQQASMDRLLQQQEFRSALAAERANGGGGKGKAERDVFGDVLGYMEKGDQQGLDQYIKAMSAFNGEAGNQLRSSLTKQQPEAGGMQWPTEKDVLASMGDPSASVPELPKNNATRGEKERLMGERALQQMAVLFRDPAKLDDYAKADRQLTLNEFGAGVAEDKLRRGGSLDDAAAAFQQRSATQDDAAKTERVDAMARASEARTSAIERKAEADRLSREARDKQSEINKLIKPPAGGYESKEDRELRLKTVRDLQAELQSLRGTNQPSTAPAAPFTKSALPPPKQAANRSYPPRG